MQYIVGKTLKCGWNVVATQSSCVRCRCVPWGACAQCRCTLCRCVQCRCTLCRCVQCRFILHKTFILIKSELFQQLKIINIEINYFNLLYILVEIILCSASIVLFFKPFSIYSFNDLHTQTSLQYCISSTWSFTPTGAVHFRQPIYWRNLRLEVNSREFYMIST